LRQAERPAAQEEAASSTKEASTANESSSSSKTPEAVRPYPKTTIVQQVCGARKRRRTRILTDTPEKNQLEAQAKASKKAKVPAQVKKAKKPQKQTETVSSEDEEEFTRANEDSNESLHIGSEQENETMEYSLGDFVLVKFSVEKKEILQFSTVNFLRRSGEKFIFPEQIDRAEIDQTDIELRLRVPQFTGGTGR
jgi:hypothetical protein